jgi:hypothetical protein
MSDTHRGGGVQVVEKVVSKEKGLKALAATPEAVAAFVAARKPRIKTLVLSYLDKYQIKHPEASEVPEWQ